MAASAWPGRMVDDVMSCIGFFTRFPVGMRPSEAFRFADALWAAPLAGLAVALAGWLAFGAAHLIGLSPMICAVLALGTTVLVTGCLHEDGLADVADGFGGGHTRERKLEIMRDSRIGSYGVSALVLTFALRGIAIAELAAPGPVLAGLLAAHAASRALLPAFMIAVPGARADGLAAGVGGPGSSRATVAVLIGLAFLCLLGPGAAVLAAAMLAIWFFALRSLALGQIGGQTGDVLGTLQQGGEIIVLVAASLFLS